MPNLYFTNPPQTTDSPDTHIARISVATTRGSSNLRGINPAGDALLITNANASDHLVTQQPTGGKNLVITDLVISSDSNLILTFKEQDDGTVFVAYVGPHTTINVNTVGKFKLATANKGLTVSSNANGNFSVLAFYYYE